MTTLSIPNAIANDTPADGNELDANFDAIAAWAAVVVETTSVLLVPTGAILPYAAAAAPSGYLLCDGTAVSRSTYATLFALISTTYGVGDGSTTFNLPNLKGKFPVGLNSADTAHDALGETGGSQDAIVVAHTHTGPSHTHTYSYPNFSADTFQEAPGGTTALTGVASDSTPSTGASGTGNTGSTGSSGTDANLPPYLTLNFVIKT